MRQKKFKLILIFAVVSLLLVAFFTIEPKESKINPNWHIVESSDYQSYYTTDPEMSSLSEESFTGVLEYQKIVVWRKVFLLY